MRSLPARLSGFALAIVIGHHVGTLFKPLGVIGPTEWADWIDLAVPFVVLGLAASVLAAAAATRRDWTLFGGAAVLYTQGHALHLAANSVSNAGPSGRAAEAAHLWDEVVSHHVWYAGLALAVLVLALALGRAGRPASVAHPAYALAALVGLTWATNAIEGGTPAFGLAVAAALAVTGWRRRGTAAGRLLVATYGVALVLLASWGAWHRGFPQFSELGWI